MPSIDVVNQWCCYNDYPIFRYWMEKYKRNFKKIILFPSRHHGVIDLEDFHKKHISNVTWVKETDIDWTEPGIDWRQVETERCLKYSDADWILFIEQDFMVKDWELLFGILQKTMKNYEMIGWWNNTAYPYMHPCFLLIKRELLEKTRKDFRAHPEIIGADHFANITRDVEANNGRILKLQNMGFKQLENAFHLGGLTYVYQDWVKSGKSVDRAVSPMLLYIYNYWSTQAPVFQNNEYIELAKKVSKVLEARYPAVNPENNTYTKFFKLW